MLYLRFTSENPMQETASYDWATKNKLAGLCAYCIEDAVNEFVADGYFFEEALQKAAKMQANFDNSHVSDGDFVIFKGSFIGKDVNGNPCFDGQNAEIAKPISVVAKGKLIAAANGGYFIDTFNS